MAAKIINVDPDSLGEELGLKPGDYLISINDHPIRDVIDYMYYEAATDLEILVEIDGEEVLIELEKESEEPLGLEFENYLMDQQRSCKNKCIFCFIDQLPKGLRKTLYFKDDDARLSFLMGNYITLTNLSEDDIERIIEMRISPINISVHTTDPALRVKMMANPNASKINEILRRFYDAGIYMNCQIVLCKGVNDKENLKKSLEDLADLAPYVQSTSVVPVGLSKHREGLYPLEPFNKEDALEVIQCINQVGQKQKAIHGVHGCYASDEFYVLAELPIPPEEDYDGYPQIENGVGLMRSLEDELNDVLSSEKGDSKVRDIGIVTGILAADYMSGLLKKIQEKFIGLQYRVYPIINHFFGERITVSGLVTATDILDQLKGEELPSVLLIPSSMLRAEQDLFLDSISLEEVSSGLKREIRVTMNDGADLLDKILGR